MDSRSTFINRRVFLLSSCCALFAGCTSNSEQPKSFKAAPINHTNSLYPAMPNEQFPIPAVTNGDLKPEFQRRMVSYETKEKPGTVVVDTKRFYLYHVQKDGRAMRYGVGLGRAGFSWAGRARIAWKRKWPKWTPPTEMIERQPELEKWSAKNGGMPPGLNNPLGSRALYIFQGKKDTLYRLHGTPQVSSIGKAVSSGCVRLVNQDVIHLYDHVRDGSTLVVI